MREIQDVHQAEYQGEACSKQVNEHTELQTIQYLCEENLHRTALSKFGSE